MTPFAIAVVFGALPAANPTPPIASNAMNAPTAAVAPLSTLRRVAPPPSLEGCVVPLLTIVWCTPPSSTSAGDHNALDEHPDHRQPSQSQQVRTDARRQDTRFVLRHAWRGGRGRWRRSLRPGRLANGRRGRTRRRRGIPLRRQTSRVSSGGERGCQLGFAGQTFQRVFASVVERGDVNIKVAIARR